MRIWLRSIMHLDVYGSYHERTRVNVNLASDERCHRTNPNIPLSQFIHEAFKSFYLYPTFIRRHLMTPTFSYVPGR
jgi:hypothetical protein